MGSEHLLFFAELMCIRKDTNMWLAFSREKQ